MAFAPLRVRFKSLVELLPKPAVEVEEIFKAVPLVSPLADKTIRLPVVILLPVNVAPVPAFPEVVALIIGPTAVLISTPVPTKPASARIAAALTPFAVPQTP